MTDYYEHKLDPVGVRPDWLADDDRVELEDGSWYPWPAGAMPADDWSFEAWCRNSSPIRIPRDHWAVPYLERGEAPPSTKRTASEHPEYSPERVEKAVEAIRRAAKYDYDDFGSECRAILSELDKSKEVDPLLLEARKFACTCSHHWPHDEIMAGAKDETPALRDIHRALRRGMELAKDAAA